MRKRPAAFKFLALSDRSNLWHQGPKEKSTDARALLGGFARRSRKHDPNISESLVLNPCNVNVRKSATGLSCRPFYSVHVPEKCPSGSSL